MQPFMGWLADRIGAERVLVSGFCVWSIATVLTGLATGFAMLFAFRLLMGTGESVAYPSAAKLLATHVEPRHRARSMGTVVLGAVVGLTGGDSWADGCSGTTAGERCSSPSAVHRSSG